MEAITEHLKEVALVDISTGRTNPRNVFNEQAIQELSESIKVNGLLQPLLVRPLGEGYELVCGERRLRACKLIDLKSVPVQIKNLNDQEALEAQIIENLEREDVHPLHEAETFKLMIDKGNYTSEGIATKIARSERFVLQRLSLNNLNAEWKKLFLNGDIHLAKALIIVRLEKKYQKEVAQNASDWSGGIKSAKQLQSFIDSNITALLSKAVFDPVDENLVKRAGACSNCPKRSGANGSLFPDVREDDRCFDKACFETKTERYIHNEIDGIVNNAESVYLIRSKHQDMDDGLSDKLKKLGINVLVHYNDFEATNGKDKGKNRPRGFWINGYERGRYTSIKLTKKQEDGSMDPKSRESVEAQIEKINNRSKRMLELDAEKVHKRIIEVMGSSEEMNQIGNQRYGDATELLSRLVLWNALDWSKKQHFSKPLHMEKYDKEGAVGILKRLAELTKDDMAIIINNVGFDAFKSALPTYSEAIALRGLAESFGTIPIEDFENEQKAIADKRLSRQMERISKLKRSVK